MKPSPFDRRSQCIEGKALVRSTLCRHKLGGRPMVAPTIWTIFTSAKLVITARPLRGRTSSDALRAPPSPRGEGSCALDVISVQARRATDGRPYNLNDFYLTQPCYHGSPASRAHLIHRRRGPPSPQGEGSVAHQNIMST